ncbi:MAG: NADPH-dependent 7-cyano-7-deazaguanine reductase QueF [Deltaproteobacteria bacterium]|nr:NADPH-dependent 7-cyano-7-deazaguanine reductase QueF [Deltaproteobacteria bacterium]
METIENAYRERDYEIDIRFPEFTCLCPKTSQPDFAEIVIIYIPNERLVELKSLKLYLNSYRDQGIFHEEAVNRILEDFVETVRPKRVEVTGKFNVRGGIHTTVTARYPSHKE